VNSQAGAYFVTICAWQRECIFGEINDAMKMNEYGLIVRKYLDKIPGHFPNVKIDMHAVMPNHIHGIIVINSCRGEVPSPLMAQPLSNTNNPFKKGGETPPLRKPSLGHIVAYF
jgi:REP element-mobilizing transposase RayT